MKDEQCARTSLDPFTEVDDVLLGHRKTGHLTGFAAGAMLTIPRTKNHKLTNISESQDLDTRTIYSLAPSALFKLVGKAIVP